MKYLSLLIALIFIVSCNSDDELNIKIEGNVFDQESMQPLKDVSITLIPDKTIGNTIDTLNRKIFADVNGRFSFDKLSPTIYYLLFESPEYESKVDIQDLRNSENVTINIDMLKIKKDFTNSSVWSSYHTGDIFILNNKNYLFKSADNGKSWIHVSRLPFLNRLEIKIVGGIMYASDKIKIYKSLDNGKNWTSLPDTGDGDSFNSFDVDVKTNDVYATTRYALFRYDGNNWHRIVTTTSDNSSECVAIDHDGNIYYSTYLFTIWKSADKGISWTVLNYTYDGFYRSTTGYMIVTDDNTLLMGRWLTGIYKMYEDNCVPLHNGLGIDWDNFKGVPIIAGSGSEYCIWLQSSKGGGSGIFYSQNKGDFWVNCNYNLSEYDLRNFNNLTMNKYGTIVISLLDKGCYILNKEHKRWELIN